MKNFLKKYVLLFSLMIVVVAATFTAFRNPGEENPPENTFAELQKGFLNPGKDYGSAPLWVWNTKVTKEIIDSMMITFKVKAFGGVFVHPRPGLITEYLSQDWFKLFQYTVQKGKQLGLNVWIYDENSYPSGFAGGLVNDEMPESYNQGQMLQLTKGTVLNEKNTQNLFVCLKEENGIFKNITSAINSEKGKSGNYYLFTKENYEKNYGIVGPAGFSYVDLMVKGVTGGNPQMIETIAKAAIAVGADGLFIETHPNPSVAKSDGANMLRLDLLEDLLVKLVKLKTAV
jgi:hypothetical protein